MNRELPRAAGTRLQARCELHACKITLFTSHYSGIRLLKVMSLHSASLRAKIEPGTVKSDSSKSKSEQRLDFALQQYNSCTGRISGLGVRMRLRRFSRWRT